jgi:methionyl-tRNA formyltransferase
MRIAFMSPDEPFYLPEFYRYVFDNLEPHHEVEVIIVPPVYKNTTQVSLALRYLKVFGAVETLMMSFNVIYFKIMDRIVDGRRGRYYSLVSLLRSYNVPYRNETDVNSERNLGKLRDWNVDLVISVSCPQIFKKRLIELPPRGCLNLHGSLLPDYRGVMPSFWMLANGESEAGSTLFFVNESIDAGDVLVQRKFPIESHDTLDSFIRRSKRIGAEMVIEGIRKIENNDISTFPLDMTKGRYFGWPTRRDVRRFIERGRRFR